MMKNSVELEQSPLINEPSIFHFFTTTSGGVSKDNYASLNLGKYAGDDIKNVEENRERLASAIGISPGNIIVPHEIHSNEIKIIDNSYFNKSANEDLDCDALITNIKNVCVAVTTADCVPILLADTNRKTVAAVHAGWRGIISRILPKTLETMNHHFGSNLNDIIMAIGPSISVEKYEVGDELSNIFRQNFDKEAFMRIDKVINGRHHIDLRLAAKIQALAAGLNEQNIYTHKGCTYTDKDKYFSARRQSINSGRMLSGILIRG